MKKLAFLLTAILVIVLSSNVFGQGSTGIEPAPGATHSYSVDNTGGTFAWSVTRGDLSTPANAAILSSTSGNSINITWADTVTVGTQFYVHVEQTISGCTNTKVLPVTIAASQFYLMASANSETSCYENEVTVSIVSDTIQYSHGTVEVVYTIAPSGLNASSTGYRFDFDLSGNLPDGYSSSDPTLSANGSFTGSTVTVSDNSTVTLTFVITNNNTYGNASDASGTAANFTATLSISGGVTGTTGTGIGDNGSGTYSDGTDVSRPATTIISTN